MDCPATDRYHDSMADEPKTERGAGWMVALCVAIVLALPAVYVLSMGPVVWLIVNDYLSEEVGTRIYVPVLWLADICPALQPPLETYLDLWQ
jgi:hypothetical protein